MSRLIIGTIRSLSRCSDAFASRRVGVDFAALSSPALATRWHPHYSNNTPRAQSSSSHDDFAPKKKVDLSQTDDDEIYKMIDSHVKANRIMLYMKGSPSQPMCGFSATVVSILKKSGADFSSVNVLDYPEVRDGVKKYSQWPTIPQLYVNGEFLGGCDIVRDMDESGELSELLKVEDPK